MASTSPVSISYASQDSSSKTGLVNSAGTSRSYGTVKDSSAYSFLGSSLSGVPCMNHPVEEGDTLQGIALKYNVTVEQIQRLNNLWTSDSLHLRPILKIPVIHSNESSRSGSPITVPPKQHRASVDQLPSKLSESETVTSYNGDRLEDDDEVRSKNSVRRRDESDSASSGDGGVKTIAGILSSADEQLKISRQFAEKLAKRCAERAPPEGAYNRTADMKTGLPTNHRRSPSPYSSFSNSFSSSSQSWDRKRRVEQRPEKESENREKVVDQIFEL